MSLEFEARKIHRHDKPVNCPRLVMFADREFIKPLVERAPVLIEPHSLCRPGQYFRVSGVGVAKKIEHFDIVKDAVSLCWINQVVQILWKFPPVELWARQSVFGFH